MFLILKYVMQVVKLARSLATFGYYSFSELIRLAHSLLAIADSVSPVAAANNMEGSPPHKSWFRCENFDWMVTWTITQYESYQVNQLNYIQRHMNVFFCFTWLICGQQGDLILDMHNVFVPFETWPKTIRIQLFEWWLSFSHQHIPGPTARSESSMNPT